MISSSHLLKFQALFAALKDTDNILLSVVAMETKTSQTYVLIRTSAMNPRRLQSNTDFVTGILIKENQRIFGIKTPENNPLPPAW